MKEIAEMKPCLKEIAGGRNKMAHGGSGIDLEMCTNIHNCILKLYSKLGFDHSEIAGLKPNSGSVEDGCVTANVKGLDPSTEVVRIPVPDVLLEGRGAVERDLVEWLSGC